MTQDTKHTPTPTPWTAEGAALLDAEGTPVALVCSIGAQEQILRAVNAHEELVEALEDARNVIKHSVRRDVFTYKQHILDKIDTALARVEGSES